MRKLLKVALIAILIMAAASWITSMAYGHDNNTFQLDATIQEGIRVEPAPAAAAPSAAFYGNAICTITPGDLFYINAANITQDITATLYITNTAEMVSLFRYMALNVAVYIQTAEGQWEKALLTDGKTPADTYLTMNNGAVTFNLPGLAVYKAVLESGSVKCHPTRGDSENAMPVFFLEAGTF